MTRFGRLSWLTLGLLAAVSQAEAKDEFKGDNIFPVVEFRDAGTFELQMDGTLVPSIRPSNIDEIVWFESINTAPSFFNIGDAPAGFPANEYVSHADGLTEDGGVICGFRLYYATSQTTGSLDIIVTYYDDGSADPAVPSPVAAAFQINNLPKPTPEDEPGAYGFAVNVTIPPALHFSLSTDEFQYGIRRIAGSGLFGPTLQQSILNQTFGQGDSTFNATVGTTYNFFEAWTPPGQNGGSPNDNGDGSGDNNWFFGPNVWAGNAHVVFAIGEAPAGTIADASVYHSSFAGSGSKVDSGKDVHIADGTPTQLGFNNLINSTGGIRGILVEFDGVDVGALEASDFEVKISPAGTFATAPQDWAAGPEPTITVDTIPEFSGSGDHAVLGFSAGSIVNRWVRIQYLPTGQTMYLGHLLGEVTGPAGSPSTYTVNFNDVSAIRAGSGQTVDSGSILDIDKSGTTSFADINAMRANIGAQLSNITVE